MGVNYHVSYPDFRVSHEESEICFYPLEENTTVEIQGHQGISVIEIDQGKAGFLDSPCANKTCVASPPISKNGEWSACLPNGIFMRIESQEEESDIDIMVF